MVRLGEIFDVQITGEWGNECAANETGTKVLRTTNFTSDGIIDFENVVIRIINKAKVEKKRLHCGDIILEKSGGTEKTPVGRVVFCDESIEDDTYLCNNFTQAMRVNQKVAFPRYVFYFMWYLHYSGRTDLLQNKTTGIRNLQVRSYLNEEIPLPPLDEQRRIAAVLDKVSGLIAKRRAQLDKLDLLVKARFVEMFGKTQYPHTALIKLIVEGAGLSYGVIVPGDNVEDGIPMIRPSDFKNDNLYLDEVYRVAPEIEAKYARTRLIGDEILVQVIGQPGQVMLADSRCKGMNVTRNLAVVRPNCNRINRIYLKTYMQTQEAQAFMLGETKQSTLKQLPLSKLKELEILVPPMALQEQFATFVEQINKSKLSVRKSLEKLKILKKALMQQYFG